MSARSYQSNWPRAVATLITLASRLESFREKPCHIKACIVLSYTNKSGKDKTVKGEDWKVQQTFRRLGSVHFYTGAAESVRSYSTGRSSGVHSRSRWLPWLRVASYLLWRRLVFFSGKPAFLLHRNYQQEQTRFQVSLVLIKGAKRAAGFKKKKGQMGSCGDLIKMSGGGEEGFPSSFVQSHPSAWRVRKKGREELACWNCDLCEQQAPSHSKHAAAPQTEACFSTTHGFNWRLPLPPPPLLQLLLCPWLKRGGKSKKIASQIFKKSGRLADTW